MQSFKSVLQLIFYLVWIPLGLILLALAMYVITANPLQRMMGSFSGEGYGPGGSSSQGGPASPSQGGQQGNFGGPSSGGFDQPFQK